MRIDEIFSFTDYPEMLALFSDTLLAGAVLGVMGGLIAIFVMLRDLAFAVHGIAEISFAGAAAALFFGGNVLVGSVMGSVIAAIILGFMGSRAQDRNSIIGVLMPFGLGLGILFLSLYQGRAGNKFGLLTGQILAVDSTQLSVLLVVAALVVLALIVMWRPLSFASVDPTVAQARGVPMTALSVGFMLTLGVAVALSIQLVGALLVLALLVTPAAAAMQVATSPRVVVALSVIFAVVSSVGGILLALGMFGARVPISPYVTTLSFVIYLMCRLIGWRRHQSVSGR